MHNKSIDSSRTQQMVRLDMLRTLERGEEDRDSGHLCGDCGLTRDTQSHCLSCPAWYEDRDRLDLECIEDLVKYFKQVLRGTGGQGREGKEKMV